MTTRQTVGRSRAAATAWRGRASEHRRQQVRDLAPVVETSGSTGPVETEDREPRRGSDTHTSIAPVWRSLVDVLEAVEAPSSALLCTASGFPVRSHGYDQADLVTAARVAHRTFALRRATTTPDPGMVVVEVVAGPTQTVMTAISSPHGEHLLTVSADGVSMPVLRAWASHVASQLAHAIAQA